MLRALYGSNKKTRTIAKPDTQTPSNKKRDVGDLSGSQFRWLNDMLYSTTSDKAFSEFTQDPDLFDTYHAGFARQAEKWPTNPVDQCLQFLRRHDKQLRSIGDFGCGEARISKELAPIQSTVHSFDLVSNGNPAITACNISRVPLPDKTLDVAVFNLSLMGTDWPTFIREARRTLKQGGLLYISEVVSRLGSVDDFETGLKSVGFRVIRSFPSQGEYFHTFIAKKTQAICKSKLMDTHNIDRVRKLLPPQVQLVAVSKTKSAKLIAEAHQAGQVHFGENYVQELCTKASEVSAEIKWHFIGHLQTNKINQLLKAVPNLHLVETVDSVKLADALNAACRKFRSTKLGVLVEVATSQETSKSGISVDETPTLVKHIKQNCDCLELRGLMTVADETRARECFAQIEKLKRELVQEGSTDWILSMGMSADWEIAVECGSNQVRIGSAIFGSR